MSQNIAITMVACLKVMVKPRYLTARKHNTRINDDNFFIYEVTLKMQLIETEMIGKHLLYDDSDLKFILIFFKVKNITRWCKTLKMVIKFFKYFTAFN